MAIKRVSKRTNYIFMRKIFIRKFSDIPKRDNFKFIKENFEVLTLGATAVGALVYLIKTQDEHQKELFNVKLLLSDEKRKFRKDF